MPTFDHIDVNRRRSIEVVDYDPDWPRQFDEIRRHISTLLAELILEIHHVGSTAIAGLCAKPKIDIDIVLRSEANIPHGIERMKATGSYNYHGERYQDGMWVFTTGRGSHGQRLYLCAPGNRTHIDRILFRDYLRRHLETANAYGALKRKLAEQAIDDWNFYTGSKGPFVADVVQQASAAKNTREG